MTREVILYVTASLDGLIADTEGGVEWLAGDEGTDYGYRELMDSIDTVLQGSHTYLATMNLTQEDPYVGKKNYVFTSRDDLPIFGSPVFVHDDAVDFVRTLKGEPGGRMWLVGGGELASTLVGAGLVDQIDLFVQPVILGDGIPLWRAPIEPQNLRLVEARQWPGDLAELRYRVTDGGGPRP